MSMLSYFSVLIAINIDFMFFHLSFKFLYGFFLLSYGFKLLNIYLQIFLFSFKVLRSIYNGIPQFKVKNIFIAIYYYFTTLLFYISGNFNFFEIIWIGISSIIKHNEYKFILPVIPDGMGSYPNTNAWVFILSSRGQILYFGFVSLLSVLVHWNAMTRTWLAYSVSSTAFSHCEHYVSHGYKGRCLWGNARRWILTVLYQWLHCLVSLVLRQEVSMYCTSGK